MSTERERIVEWLRGLDPDAEGLTTEQPVDAGGWNTSADVLDPDKLADAIERGAHIPAKDLVSTVRVSLAGRDGEPVRVSCVVRQGDKFVLPLQSSPIEVWTVVIETEGVAER